MCSKKKIGFAVMFAASLSLVSCSNEDDLSGKELNGRTPITLSSNIALSRVIDQTFQNTQIANGVRVGVFVRPASGEGNLVADNHSLTADGSGAFTGASIYYPVGGGAVSVYAYAPYKLDWDGKLNTANEFTVSDDQSTDNGFTGSDLLRGEPDDNSLLATEDEVFVRFKHMLTKLNINFDTSNSDVDLKGAEINVISTLPTTTFNILSGEIGVASGTVTSIKVAEFADDASTFTASAVIVPQAITTGTKLIRVRLADGKTIIDAILNEAVTFESGKKYTYTVKLGEGGTTATMTLDGAIDDWKDGNHDLSGGTEEKVVYEVGDFVMFDGSFLKSTDVNEINKEDIAAIIFSTNVSEADRKANYNAYAMNVQSTGNKGWVITDLITESVDNFAVAFADMDGLSHTNAVLTSNQYSALKEEKDDADSNNFGKCIFECLSRVGVGSKKVSGGSDWFVPSFGQMIAVLNNLGNAGISIGTVLDESAPGSKALYVSSDLTAIQAVNTHFTKAGITNGPLSTGLYMTTTESGIQFWNINVQSDHFEFGRSAYKNGTSRRAACCVAVKLPR